MWQFIAGGGEDEEKPQEAAQREAMEEAGIAGLRWISLDSVATIPRAGFPDSRHWPAELLVVPEYCFAVEVANSELQLSEEHSRAVWLSYEEARARLTWDSNRTALWELDQRLRCSIKEPL